MVAEEARGRILRSFIIIVGNLISFLNKQKLKLRQDVTRDSTTFRITCTMSYQLQLNICHSS